MIARYGESKVAMHTYSVMFILMMSQECMLCSDLIMNATCNVQLDDREFDVLSKAVFE